MKREAERKDKREAKRQKKLNRKVEARERALNPEPADVVPPELLDETPE